MTNGEYAIETAKIVVCLLSCHWVTFFCVRLFVPSKKFL